MDPCQRTYHSEWTQGNLGSPFLIDPQAIILIEGIIGTAYIKHMCFISTIPVHFILSTIKVSKYYFVFISFISIFHIILYSFKEMPPSQQIPDAIPWRGTNTEISVIRESGATLKDTNPPFVWLSRREKDGAQPIISYMCLMVYLIMVDMSFS